MVVSSRHGIGVHALRACATLIPSVCFLLTGAARASAQDLGELARQEQARKQAQGTRPVHVYTNDDLARPHILVPEDAVNFEVSRRKLPPALMLLPPAAEPETADAQEIPLGEVARKYSEQKVEKRKESAQEFHAAGPIYVYTNDDLVRPTILTPEDNARYQAALERPIKAVPKVHEEAAEASLAPPPVPAPAELPLGDLARMAYQQEHPPAPVYAMHRRFQPHPHLAKLVAYRTVRPVRLPPGTESLPAGMTFLASRGEKQPEPPPVQPAPSSAQPQARTREDRLEATASALPTAAVEPSHRVVTLHAGDSLWKLARRYLGHGSQWRALLEANPWIADPSRLRVGTQIRI
jgi:hypothetical protein